MSLEIVKPMNVIVIDGKLPDNETIKGGTELFCGNCGKSMGKVKSDLKFPFDTATLAETLDNSTFRVIAYGIIHKTCGNAIKTDQESLKFITRDTFDRNQS